MKKKEVQMEFLVDIEILLMVEKGIRGGMCQAIQKGSSYIIY